MNSKLETARQIATEYLKANWRLEAIHQVRCLGYSYIDARAIVNTVALDLGRLNPIW